MARINGPIKFVFGVALGIALFLGATVDKARALQAVSGGGGGGGGGTVNSGTIHQLATYLATGSAVSGSTQASCDPVAQSCSFANTVINLNDGNNYSQIGAPSTSSATGMLWEGGYNVPGDATKGAAFDIDADDATGFTGMGCESPASSVLPANFCFAASSVNSGFAFGANAITDATGAASPNFPHGLTSASVPIAPLSGGVGASLTLAVGDILYATSSTVMARLADVASGSVLCAGGVTTAPSWCSAPAISGANFTAGTVPNASLVTAALTAASTLDTTKLSVAAIPNGVTATTQTVNDNSTKLATTAYADLALTGDVTKPAGSHATTLANIPALSGANLTSLNASNISSGTLAAARGGWGSGTFQPIVNPCTSAGSHTTTANSMTIIPMVMGRPFTLATGMGFKLGVGDAGHPTDAGLYYCATPGSSTCTLIEDIGAQTISSTTFTTYAFQTNAGCTGNLAPGGLCTGSGTGTYPALPVTEPAGLYVFAMTSTAGTVTTNYCSNVQSDVGWFAVNFGYSATTNAVLTATITSPTLAWQSGGAWTGLFY